MIPDRDPTDAELVAILRSDAAWLGSYGVEDPVIAGHVARAADRIEALAAEKRVERLEEKLTAMERERNEARGLVLGLLATDRFYCLRCGKKWDVPRGVLPLIPWPCPACGYRGGGYPDAAPTPGSPVPRQV